MKSTALFLALALFSCKTEKPAPEDEANVCNCGVITALDGQPLNDLYYLYIESECSGELNHVLVDLQTYNGSGAGQRICVNSVAPW